MKKWAFIMDPKAWQAIKNMIKALRQVRFFCAYFPHIYSNKKDAGRQVQRELKGDKEMIKRYVDSRYLTRAEHITYIKELAKELGYTPTKKDVPTDRMILIKKHYTTWLDVIRQAGIEPASTQRQKRLRQEALDRRLYIIAEEYDRYGYVIDRDMYEFLKEEYTYNEKRVPMGYEAINARSGKEEIRMYLKCLADELGYTPTVRVTSGASQIIRTYNSWYEAIDDAGLERPNSIRQTRLRKEASEKNFDRLLRSIGKDIKKKTCEEYV